ncbi:MAG: hypothetical protein KTR32_24875 [Granulosicoccus sp.]|nr:hypothetical protein [Granulosicoccus sp.]
MNPYQVMGIIVACTAVFTGLVVFLSMQGVPVLVALLGVYLVSIVCMLSMQRRAGECFDIRDDRRSRHYVRDPERYRVTATDFDSTNSAASAVSERLP